MNAIAVYVATHLFDFTLIGNVFVKDWQNYMGSWFGFVQASGCSDSSMAYPLLDVQEENIY